MTLIEHVRVLFSRAFAWWRPIPEEPPPPLPPEPDEPPQIVVPVSAVAENEHGKLQTDDDFAKHELGEFYFRETILDQLDYYFTCIERLRRTDVEAYAMYSRVGANVFPNTTLLPNPTPGVVSPWFREHLPAFGAVFFGGHVREFERPGPDRKLHPRFMYFCKYERDWAPPKIERVSTGTVYTCTAYWDDDKDPFIKEGWPTTFPIVVEDDGRVRLLRTRELETIKIKLKRRDYGYERGPVSYEWVERMVWRKAHWFFEEWAAENRDRLRFDTPSFLENFFVMTMNMFERSNSSMIRVAVSKGEQTAALGVNIKRTPYFFKDREVVVGATGKRKRIFHIVRPHARKDGAVVRMHFRGMRDFIWNGYRVLISVPGVHHASVLDLTSGFYDDDRNWRKHKGMKGLGWMSRRIREHVTRTVRVSRHGASWRRSA